MASNAISAHRGRGRCAAFFVSVARERGGSFTADRTGCFHERLQPQLHHTSKRGRPPASRQKAADRSPRPRKASVPPAGPSQRRAHPRGTSQLGSSSAVGQPTANDRAHSILSTAGHRAALNGAGLVEDADGQTPGVQINAAVESVHAVVETHHGLLGLSVGLSPQRGWLGDCCALPENPTRGTRHVLDPAFYWDRLPPIPLRPS